MPLGCGHAQQRGAELSPALHGSSRENELLAAIFRLRSVIREGGRAERPSAQAASGSRPGLSGPTMARVLISALFFLSPSEFEFGMGMQSFALSQQ